MALMKYHATQFHFCQYQFEPEKKRIRFSYRVEFSNRAPLAFEEEIRLPRAPRRLPPESLRLFFESLHLMLGISYYKLYFPPRLRVPYKLSREQCAFWNTIYRKGLGEFLYKNRLDPKRVARFTPGKASATPVRVDVSERALLGIGGGKDSIVAAELLKGTIAATSFLVQTQRQDTIASGIAHAIGNPVLSVRRVLDPKLASRLEGAYQGHVPISAIYAFLGLLAGALYGYRYAIVGNEHSSNVGNLRYRAETVNHQWSKSGECEALIQRYTRTFITPDITYFSLLRPFYEIRIAKLFAKHKKYFPLFSSCNRNFTSFGARPTTRWCGACPKCAFVFLILAPFVPKMELLAIFGKNLFAQAALLPLFADVLGFGAHKPFDCVGTFEEAQAALFLASKTYKNDLVVRAFVHKIKRPAALVEQVMKTQRAPTLPTPFRLLGIDSVCLLGYGREGKVTRAYLKKRYPRLTVGILDARTDKHYLARQAAYDLAVKTPGIPKTKVTIPYVTATNLFFSQIKNPVIGVTGSKGKSTTASLIAEMLRAAGKKVRLVGNVGDPMLRAFLGTVDPKEIFVVELSSYMLDDIEYSPHVALLINLFPEHMDYHGGVEPYFQAKENIFAFQKPGDVALRPPFHEEVPLSASEIPLLGPHNRKNIQAAIRVARLFGVTDAHVRKALKAFQPLPHRLEFVADVNGIRFYDDAISTTPESTLMAMKSLKHIGTIFLGGEDRGYDFRKLEQALRAYPIRNVVLFPDSGKRILTSRRGLNVLSTRSMKTAVRFAFAHTRPGEICLLSTASPSYSLWKNFEEKGDAFQRAVRAHAVGK